jgi:bifunctional DNase/RNase
MEFVFNPSTQEEEAFVPEDLVRLMPFGVTLSTELHRPFLILKDEKHEHTLPVAMNSLEAGVTLSQANKAAAPVTPHKFTEVLLQSLNMQISQCVFVEVKGSHQYVRLFMHGHATVPSFKMKAEEAMSLCLHLGTPIFATKKIMGQSQVLMAELDSLVKGVVESPMVFDRKHHYVM